MTIHTDELTNQPNNLDAGYTVKVVMLWNGGGIQNGGDLGLNLNGNGLTVGVWEAVEAGTDSWQIRNTHQELTGRVAFGEVGTGFSNHATHVAGTIAATGTDRRARGMANLVNIRSYSADNDVAELQGNAGLVVVSNHSYNQVNGWDSGNVGDARNPVRDVDGDIIGTGIINNTDIWQGAANISLIEDSNFGHYGDIARDIDNTLFNNPLLLSVWAAGNDRSERYSNRFRNNTYVIRFENNPNITGLNWTQPGWYQVPTSLLPPPGIDGNTGAGYDSLPDAPVAKNTLVVGSITDTQSNPYENSSPSISNFSAWGPTDDGRVKPDIVAKGQSLYSSLGTSDTAYGDSQGTSMAAPVVTGTSVLLIQHFQNLFNNRPRSATTKGLIIHTANDLGNPGPDYQTGWGMLNGTVAADFLTQVATQNASYILRENSYTGTQQTFQIASNGIDPLKATIVWTDPAGPIQANGLDVNTRVLVNDLELSITDPNGVVHFPWTLDPNNPGQAAIQTVANRLDNVEQVLINTPIAGTYTINVDHAGNSFNQNYSILVSTDVNNQPIANANGKYFVPEGRTISLSSMGSNDPDGIINFFHWDFNYDGMDANLDGSTFDIDAVGASPVFDAQDMDADRLSNNIRKIALGIIDNRGATGLNAVDLEIINVSPTAFITGDILAVPGLTRNFSFSAIDPSKADTKAGFEFNINYGDGTNQVLNATNPFSLAHTYTSEGNNAITVTATDKDGGVSNVATHTIEIRAAVLLPSPDNPSSTCLYVGATLGSDQIDVAQKGNTGVYEVLLNGQSKGSFAPSECITIYGQDGNDNFNVSNSYLPVKMYGSAGNDSFTGGSAQVFMFGGIDNDIYNVNSISDFVIEYVNEGLDTVNTSIDYTLGANLENLNLLEGSLAFSGAGNELNNIINGNSANNPLNGDAGNDFLNGHFGADTLSGGDGDDWLFGGNGNDILTGGSGNDVFIYSDITDAGDMIVDFTIGSDKIVLTDVLRKVGYKGSNPIGDSYLAIRQVNAGLTSIQIDPDGLGKAYRPAPLLLMKNVQASSLNLNSCVI
jgi:Ca2+-binding RTX toxin-like protein